jgi:hypothetical protein
MHLRLSIFIPENRPGRLPLNGGQKGTEYHPHCRALHSRSTTAIRDRQVVAGWANFEALSSRLD